MSERKRNMMTRPEIVELRDQTISGADGMPVDDYAKHESFIEGFIAGMNVILHAAPIPSIIRRLVPKVAANDVKQLAMPFASGDGANGTTELALEPETEKKAPPRTPKK